MNSLVVLEGILLISTSDGKLIVLDDKDLKILNSLIICKDT